MNTPINIYQALQSAPLDPVVGIRVVRITGDDSFALFAAEIAAGKRVGAHFHSHGHETYQIVEGGGMMVLGWPEGDTVQWEPPFSVSKGDCFTVAQGQVHQLINSGNAPLIAIFGCMSNHLSTDRTMVDGFGEKRTET